MHLYSRLETAVKFTFKLYALLVHFNKKSYEMFFTLPLKSTVGFIVTDVKTATQGSSVRRRLRTPTL